MARAESGEVIICKGKESGVEFRLLLIEKIGYEKFKGMITQTGNAEQTGGVGAIRSVKLYPESLFCTHYEWVKSKNTPINVKQRIHALQTIAVSVGDKAWFEELGEELRVIEHEQDQRA